MPPFDPLKPSPLPPSALPSVIAKFIVADFNPTLPPSSKNNHFNLSITLSNGAVKRVRLAILRPATYQGKEVFATSLLRENGEVPQFKDFDVLGVAPLKDKGGAGVSGNEEEDGDWDQIALLPVKQLVIQGHVVADGGSQLPDESKDCVYSVPATFFKKAVTDKRWEALKFVARNLQIPLLLLYLLYWWWSYQKK